MSSIEEVDYDSSDDDDYVPECAEEDVDEPSGDEYDEVTLNEDVDSVNSGRGKRKKEKKEKQIETTVSSQSCQLSAEAKSAVDEAFEELMAESGQTSSFPSTEQPKPKQETKQKTEEKTKITEVFDFAGEEINIEKEVSVEEARTHEEKEQRREVTKKSAQKRVGLGDAITLLVKKPKISVLDKSNLDWQSFKKDESIDEELSSFNRGKNGYLSRQQFLLNADHAQFEQEKSMRDAIRKQNQL